MTEPDYEDDGKGSPLPPARWIVKDYEPEDEAPKGDPELDCTGEDDATQ